ncbi:DUF2812 domain-containing protein [Bacillus pseudomycoides]|uniref:DUF2812 domain-containing protein n=1 Tax=Bacillus pseudomycoides TaxID=64104 RepID=A0AAJ2DQ82_9BACI|nr:DUF2812 domain-containing protein [Bacillus pseudomycoides]EEM10733.1 hypothetical protein bmyco0003_24840 [Bacillus pseudomycoides]MCR8858014.1 DUF2812 domain-containing protein [Bacillus pseudomycoides]MDR4329097.1 DUF2812 domain-containing protein [Bacillus pseudomycoides]MED1536387.1 DUF2812 domain-containing protein [Bacillus pseudomycoides]PDZ09794.1 DUF2812 domain-containing protein [Bacillus pseudomycoides]
MEIKKTLKFFAAWNLEKEEAYLRKMHQKGWAFQNYNFMYTFKKTEPKDVVYKADFKLDNRNSQMNQKEYIEIYEMSGWKHVTSFTKWHYFCKEVDDDNDLPDIYSEKETKIEKLMDLMRFFGIIFVIEMLGMYLNYLGPSAANSPIWIKLVVGLCGCINVYVFVRLFWKIRKFKKEVL